MPRDSLGDFEQSVLLSILHLGEGAYGVTIIDDLIARSGRPVSRAAVYIALRRLEEKRFVSSRLERSADAIRKPRRFVSVTPSGLAALRTARQVMNRMWAGLENLTRKS